MHGGMPQHSEKVMAAEMGTPYTRGYAAAGGTQNLQSPRNPVYAGVCRFLAFANASRCWEPRIHGGIPVCRVGSKVH